MGLIKLRLIIKKLKMKSILFSSLLLSAVLVFGISCKKYSDPDPGSGQKVDRKVQFVLFTTADHSTDNHQITFRLAIQNYNGQFLWDSVLAPIAIKNIPDLAHKISVEKTISANSAQLKVGFYYSIEDVGNSWHLESFDAGTSVKTVNFDFQ